MNTNPEVLPAVQGEQLPARQEPSLGVMLQRALEKDITKDSAEAIKVLAEVYERMEERRTKGEAKAKFFAAFTKLQRELPVVVAEKVVPTKAGGVKYTYSPYEEIWAQCRDAILANGFSVGFSQRTGPAPGECTCICTLMHEAGHEKVNEFTGKIGAGPYDASDTQAAASAGTVYQREAFCDALNIIRRHDDDARKKGSPITAEQAASLRERVRATASDEAAFLRFAAADSYEAISTAKYAVLDASLRRKEKTSA